MDSDDFEYWVQVAKISGIILAVFVFFWFCFWLDSDCRERDGLLVRGMMGWECVERVKR